GPGKALKLTIRPVQDRIPILLAVLGPKNVALAGEIADGWLPVFFSPEHTTALRGPLEEGAARANRSLDDFRICPSVNVMISDDLASARNAMRPILALYVGGMGSREQNFYNRLVSSYGFAEAAAKVQELYLAGPKTAAMLALPDDLLAHVSLLGLSGLGPGHGQRPGRSRRHPGGDRLGLPGQCESAPPAHPRPFRRAHRRGGVPSRMA